MWFSYVCFFGLLTDMWYEVTCNFQCSCSFFPIIFVWMCRKGQRRTKAHWRPLSVKANVKPQRLQPAASTVLQTEKCWTTTADCFAMLLAKFHPESSYFLTEKHRQKSLRSVAAEVLQIGASAAYVRPQNISGTNICTQTRQAREFQQFIQDQQKGQNNIQFKPHAAGLASPRVQKQQWPIQLTSSFTKQTSLKWIVSVARFSPELMQTHAETYSLYINLKRQMLAEINSRWLVLWNRWRHLALCLLGLFANSFPNLGVGRNAFSIILKAHIMYAVIDFWNWAPDRRHHGGILSWDKVRPCLGCLLKITEDAKSLYYHKTHFFFPLRPKKAMPQGERWIEPPWSGYHGKKNQTEGFTAKSNKHIGRQVTQSEISRRIKKSKYAWQIREFHEVDSATSKPSSQKHLPSDDFTVIWPNLQPLCKEWSFVMSS